MTIEIKIFEASQTIVAQWGGILDFDAFWAAYNSVYKKIAHWEQLVEVVDLESRVKLQAMTRDLRDIAQESADWLSRRGISTRKVLIAPDDLTFGMARVYYAQASFCAHETVFVVRTREEAAEALEMDLATLTGYLDGPSEAASDL